MRLIVEKSTPQIEVVRVVHPLASTARCVECFRVFDLYDETDAQEWFYGHDCEVAS
jgi:hypothetical protein